MAAALTDSRWLAEDIGPSVPPRGTLTLTADVSTFSPDENDPDLADYSGFPTPDLGNRTAWARLEVEETRNVTIDASASDYATAMLVMVWSVDAQGACTFFDYGTGDAPLDEELVPGSYLIEFVTLLSGAPSVEATAATDADGKALVVGDLTTETSATYERSA